MRASLLAVASFSAVGVVTFTATVAWSQGAPALLTGDNLEYLGAFAFPAGDDWAYSGHALAFDPSGDSGGSTDGFPGSLFAAAHAQQDLVGEMSIPAPVDGVPFSGLPLAVELQAPADITGGAIAALCGAYAGSDCDTWDIGGLEVLPALDKVAWNVYDWYNVAPEDMESLGWSDRDMGSPEGVWHIGPRPNDTYPYEFHNGKTCDYLLSAPAAFAADHLGGRSLVSGYHRPSGSHGGSQGPTLFASAPWLDGSPPVTGQNLDALALVYYPWVLACTENDFTQCVFPGYRVNDSWGGAAWIDTGTAHGIVVFGLKGLGDNCYGIPDGSTAEGHCAVSLCTPYKGWNSDPYQPRLLFYDPDDLAAVAAGSRNPWDVLPYLSLDLTSEVFDADCARLRGVALDRDHGLIYVAESEVGEFGETAVHVWRVNDAVVFKDDFESGDSAAWSSVQPVVE